MGLIKVRLEGHKKNGGYLTIMRPNMDETALRMGESKLTDGYWRYIQNGPQTVRFDSVGFEKRKDVFMESRRARDNYRYGNSVAGKSFDRYLDAICSEAGLPNYVEYTFNVEDKTLLTVVVTSDYNGKIIGNPEFIVTTMSDEEIKEFERQREEEWEAYKKSKDYDPELDKDEEDEDEENEEKIRLNLKKQARASVIKSLVLFVLAAILILIANNSEGIITLVGFGGLALGIWAIKIFFSNIFNI